MSTAEARINYDAPYRTPEQAIRSAYATEATAIVEVTSFFTQMRGGTVRLPGRDPMSPHDRHAQAAMVLVFAARNLTALENVVLRARHTIASSRVLGTRKDVDARLLYESFVVGHEPRGAPAEFGDYALDAIRGWTRLRRCRREKWWAKRFKHDVSTLWRWRWGDKHRRREGFCSRIEGVYQTALGKLADPMYAAGLTQE